MKKCIPLIFALLLFVGCEMAMEDLDVRNGTRYIVTSKKKKEGNFHYNYRLIKVGDKWYDYNYIDTTEFNIGDTLVLKIEKIGN